MQDMGENMVCRLSRAAVGIGLNSRPRLFHGQAYLSFNTYRTYMLMKVKPAPPLIYTGTKVTYTVVPVRRRSSARQHRYWQGRTPRGHGIALGFRLMCNKHCESAMCTSNTSARDARRLLCLVVQMYGALLVGRNGTHDVCPEDLPPGPLLCFRSGFRCSCAGLSGRDYRGPRNEDRHVQVPTPINVTKVVKVRAFPSPSL
jgi:hypothetical protein